MSETDPTFAYIPGGPFPRPVPSVTPRPIEESSWKNSVEYLLGFRLFNLGCYWEAHEVWEGLWHVHHRVGPTADLLKGLIKLAAAGVKVRQDQSRGVVTHATRAVVLFESVRRDRGRFYLGLDLDDVSRWSRAIADRPPAPKQSLSDPLVRVFEFSLGPALD